MISSYNDLLAAIRQLTPEEWITLLEAISQMLREDLNSRSSNGVGSHAPSAQAKMPVVLKPVTELLGSLNPQGRIFTDEELNELKYGYLTEKYGLQ